MPLKISRILHAGYIFECDNTKIAFDPIFENPFSTNCHAYPNIRFDQDKIKQLKLDAVFISHFHDDHCSLESLHLLNRQTPIYLYCIFEELAAMIRKLGFTKVYSLTLDEPICVGSFQVIPRRALDEDVDSLFQIQAAGLNILNVVDSWIDSPTMDQLAEYSPWDLILWPFQTMREIEVLSPLRAMPIEEKLPSEWIDQLRILKPRYVVPSSCQFILEDWSWYNHTFFPVSYKQFQNEIESALPKAKVVRLNPSVSVVLDQNSILKSDSLSWIEPKGDQEVDYEYDPNFKPPSTLEIARHFQALTDLETEQVHKYCRSGLISKYGETEASEQSFFNQIRYWRLSVYDHTGEATTYHYELDGSNIKLVTQSKHPLSWTTEIPLAKFYAALEYGEPLTSLYMRINDMIFEPSVEKAMESVDIVEDPLIRCLFSSAFGAYQRTQLKRITGH